MQRVEHTAVLAGAENRDTWAGDSGNHEPAPEDQFQNRWAAPVELERSRYKGQTIEKIYEKKCSIVGWQYVQNGAYISFK